MPKSNLKKCFQYEVIKKTLQMHSARDFGSTSVDRNPLIFLLRSLNEKQDLK